MTSKDVLLNGLMLGLERNFERDYVHTSINVELGHLLDLASTRQEIKLLRGGIRDFLTGEGLTLMMRGLKYSFQSITLAKTLRKDSFSPSYGELACSDGGYSPLVLPWRHL